MKEKQKSKLTKNVMVLFDPSDWSEFKKMCEENGFSAHGKIRRFVKNQLKKNEL